MSRSNKKLSKAEGGQIIDHQKYIKSYRSNVMRVIRDIEAGTVSELDLEKIRNFCQMSLALMDVVPMHVIQSAWRNAEILSFVNEPTEDPATDTEVVRGETPFQQKQLKGNFPFGNSGSK